MKEEELIKKLEILKSLEPEKATLFAIKKDVFSKVRGKKASPNLKALFGVLAGFRLPPLFLYPALGLLILSITVLTNRAFVTDQYQTTSAKVRIALAQDEYQKTKIALELSQKQLKENPDQFAMLSSSTRQANTYISALNLIGVPGRYTQQQCLDLYKQYHDYLEQVKKTIAKQKAETSEETKLNQLSSFEQEILNFENQAHERIKMY